MRQHRLEALGHVLLAAVEAADGDDHRRRRRRLRHLPVGHDRRALEGDAQHFERRVEQLAVGEEGGERLLVGLLLAGRVRHRPAREGVVAPRLDEIPVGLFRRARQLGLRLLPIALADQAPGRRPFVAVEAPEPTERLAHLLRLEADQRIAVAVGPRLRLGLQLLQRALRRHLRHGGNAAERNDCGKQGDRRERTYRHVSPP